MSAPLVTCPISQTFIELYPASIRIKRPFTGEPPTPPERIETTIQGFSKKSRSRLRFTAANSNEKILTQFCMTYADVWLTTQGRLEPLHHLGKKELPKPRISLDS